MEEEIHYSFMLKALEQAQNALDFGEVPIGSIVTYDNTIIGTGYNRIESLDDATAHAEIIAIHQASVHQKTWRLSGCTLYVTLEPCLMCLGAILQSRIDTIVIGAVDNKFGAIITNNITEQCIKTYSRFPKYISGICELESKTLLQKFFKKIRKKN